MTEPGPAPSKPASTARAMAFVYAGYAFRYLYLLILVPFYGRVLGVTEYGRLLAAMSLFQVVWTIAAFGFTSAGVRDAAAASDTGALARIYGRHAMGRLVMVGPALLVGVGATAFSPLLREQPSFGALAVLNGLVAASNLGWFFQGTLRFRTSVALEVLGFAINLPLILLLVRGPGDAWIVLATLLGSSLISTAVAHGLALRSLRGGRIVWRGGFTLLRETTALFANTSVTMLMTGASVYLFSLFALPAQVGLYGAAERLMGVGLSVMQPANQVMVGTVASRLGAREDDTAGFALMQKGLLGLAALGLLMLVGTLIAAGFAVPLILGSAFAPSVPMLQILALAFPFAAFCDVVANYVLIPLRRDGLVSKTTLLGAFVTVSLIFVLGPVWQGTGVAWARPAGYAAMAVAYFAILRKTGIWAQIFLGPRALSRASEPRAATEIRPSATL